MTKTFIVHSVFALALLATAACGQNPPPPPPGGATPPPPPLARAPAPPPPAAGAPAPPAAAGPVEVQSATAAPISESGSVRYIIYGPQGEIQALILRNDKIVTIPPELGAQMRIALTQGMVVSITGIPQYFGRHRQVFAQSIQVNGQNLASAAPAAGPAPGQPPPDGAQPPPPPPPQ